MSKHKTNAPLFLYFEGQNNLYPSFSCCRNVEIIFKIKLNTLFTKYTDTLISNFAHIIYLQWCIMQIEVKYSYLS